MQETIFDTKKPLKKVKNWKNFLDKWQSLSESRITGIKIANNQFDKYCIDTYGKTQDEIIEHVKTYDVDERDDLMTDLVQDFINFFRKTHVVPVIRGKISGINKYLKYRKVGVDTQELVYPQTLREEPHALTIDEIHKIFKVAKWHKQAYYLALISTGARPVEIIGLRVKDITWNQERRCYVALIPAYLTKKKLARTTRFSTEVTPYLNRILGNLKNETDLVFTKNSNLKYARSNEGVVFKSYCEKVGLDKKFETTGRMKVNLYCFRGYFFTNALGALSDSKDMAHALIGHGAYIQEYQRRTLPEKLDLWEEVESSVLVFDLEKKNHEIKKLKEAKALLIQNNLEKKDIEDQLKTERQARMQFEKEIKQTLAKLREEKLSNFTH